MNPETYKKYENLILVVSGGIGRNIFSTAVVRNLKLAYPDKKITVICGCPEIFVRNPNVHKVLRLGQVLNFYEDYVLEKKSLFLEVEPYRHPDYIYEKKHIVECWCNLLGVQCRNIKPEMFFTQTEMKMAQLQIQKSNEPMVLIQHSGGKEPNGLNEQEQIIAHAGMHKRSLVFDTMQKVVYKLKEAGFKVGSVQGKNQTCLKEAERVTFPIRAITAMIPFVRGVICIDSFLQHACAIFEKKALVLWGGTHPSCLGYPSAINLTQKKCDNPHCHRPNSYLFDFETTGFMWDCPYDSECMNYSSEYILNNFFKILEEEKHEQSIGSIGSETSGGAEASRNNAVGGIHNDEEKGIDGSVETGGRCKTAGLGSACPCE